MAKRLTGLGLAFNETHAARAAAVRPRLPLVPDVAGERAAGIEILVGDQFGRVLGELRPELVGVAWKRNNYGQARMTLAEAETRGQESMFQFGNRMLIRFGNGLPNWGGVIDTPRRWESGTFDLVAYSAEYTLGWRVTDRGRYFEGAPAGEIFRRVIREAAPFGMRLGEVWTGGLLHGPEYHYDDLLYVVQKSITQRLEAADWDVTATLEAGYIVFTANFYERRGIDHGRQLALMDGVNVTPATLNEQGTIANDVYLAGYGTGWGADNRIYSHASDAVSVGRYGLRQAGDVQVDVKVQATLDANAATMVAQDARPRKVVSFEALDLAPARFHQYDVGDSLWAEIPWARWGGYAGPVRVVAREYLPGSNRCSLVLE